MPNICADKPVPTLVIQGADDEYGTIAQCRAIERGIGSQVSTLFLPECGHAPHLEQRERTLKAMLQHIQKIVAY